MLLGGHPAGLDELLRFSGDPAVDIDRGLVVVQGTGPIEEVEDRGVLFEPVSAAGLVGSFGSLPDYTLELLDRGGGGLGGAADRLVPAGEHALEALVVFGVVAVSAGAVDGGQ